MLQTAGQVGLFESILIIIGILWLFGYLRKIVYVPVVVKQEKKKEEEPSIRINPDVKITKKSKDSASDSEYVDYEEIK